MSVRQRRIDKGWSQEDLARASGLSIRTVQRIEAGKKAGFNTLRSMALAFEIETSELIEETAMPAIETAPTNRLYFLDNLRTFMVFLVVMYHSGIVYESSGVGAYFWIVDDASTNDISGLLNLVIDIFVMSMIFFISGFFTPRSVKSKSAGAFIRSKIRRLMVPWAIASLTLVPLYKFIFLYSRGLPQEGWDTYFHFSNGLFSQSWLWFLPVLFVFDMLYCFGARANIKLPAISVRAAIGIIFIVGWGYSVSMNLLGAQGWTKTPFLDFQNERIAIYFMMFLLGALCFKQKIFEGAGDDKKLSNIMNAASWLPITLYIAGLIYTLVKPDEPLFSRVVDQMLVRLFFHVSLLSLMYTATMTFKRHFNTQGKLARELSQNSYSVYIIHVAVIGVLALGLMHTNIPSIGKYVILTASTFVVCNLIISTYRRLVDRNQ